MKKGLVENILILSLSQNHHSSNNKTNQKVSLSLSINNNKLLQKSLFIVTVYCTTGST